MKALLEQFHNAILTQQISGIVTEVKTNPRIAPEKQLAIYIDGYRIRLVQAIRADYPALLALMGNDVFDAQACDFIEQHPPDHFSLDRYPQRFASFFAQRSDDAFAAELATLEGAIADVFLMPESEAAGVVTFADLTPEAFGTMRLLPRSASRLLHMSHPVHVWLLAQRQGKLPKRPTKVEEFLYLYRHRHEVQRVVLHEAAYRLLEQLASGKTLAEALDQVTAAHLQYLEVISDNLQSWFSQWIAQGFFQATHVS